MLLPVVFLVNVPETDIPHTIREKGRAQHPFRSSNVMIQCNNCKQIAFAGENIVFFSRWNEQCNEGHDHLVVWADFQEQEQSKLKIADTFQPDKFKGFYRDILCFKCDQRIGMFCDYLRRASDGEAERNMAKFVITGTNGDKNRVSVVTDDLNKLKKDFERFEFHGNGDGLKDAYEKKKSYFGDDDLCIAQEFYSEAVESGHSDKLAACEHTIKVVTDYLENTLGDDQLQVLRCCTHLMRWVKRVYGDDEKAQKKRSLMENLWGLIEAIVITGGRCDVNAVGDHQFAHLACVGMSMFAKCCIKDESEAMKYWKQWKELEWVDLATLNTLVCCAHVSFQKRMDCMRLLLADKGWKAEYDSVSILIKIANTEDEIKQCMEFAEEEGGESVWETTQVHLAMYRRIAVLADDLKRDKTAELANLWRLTRLNHKIEINAGVLAWESALIEGKINWDVMPNSLSEIEMFDGVDDIRIARTLTIGWIIDAYTWILAHYKIYSDWKELWNMCRYLRDRDFPHSDFVKISQVPLVSQQNRDIVKIDFHNIDLGGRVPTDVIVPIWLFVVPRSIPDIMHANDVQIVTGRGAHGGGMHAIKDVVLELFPWLRKEDHRNKGAFCVQKDVLLDIKCKDVERALRCKFTKSE